MNQVIRTGLVVLGSLLTILVLLISMLSSAGAAEDPVVRSSAGVVETAAPANVENELVVAFPQVGEVVTSPLGIEGRSSAQRVGYRLFAAGSPLREGSINVDGEGTFSTTVKFFNNCCIELTLEVFDIEPDTGLGVSIPLTYAETS